VVQQIAGAELPRHNLKEQSSSALTIATKGMMKAVL